MFADSVMESSSTTGTGSYTLVGAVGYSRTFAQDFANGDTVAYFVSNLAKTRWEFCTGTLTIGPPRTLTRTVRKSSNAGAAIDWQASDVYYVFSIASADVLSGVIAGNLAATRPWWVRTGSRWWDHAASLAVSWIDRLATGAATNTRIGVYDVVKDAYFADGRRPWTSIGAANKTIAAADIGGIFTQNNAAADRTFTLPAHDAAGAGHGFTPEHGYSAGDQITEGHASAYSTLYIPMPVVTTSKLIGIQLGQSAGYVVTIRTSGVTTASVTAGSWKYAFVADRGWG